MSMEEELMLKICTQVWVVEKRMDVGRDLIVGSTKFRVNRQKQVY
jgi:hypothetical protein